MQGWDGDRLARFPARSSDSRGRRCHAGTVRSMRQLGLLGLLAVCLACHGCLGEVLGTVVAPQAVAAGAASNLVNQGASAVDGANEAASTASDLDRIIAANPDAG